MPNLAIIKTLKKHSKPQQQQQQQKQQQQETNKQTRGTGAVRD